MPALSKDRLLRILQKEDQRRQSNLSEVPPHLTMDLAQTVPQRIGFIQKIDQAAEKGKSNNGW
jgi:hypothetical protein